MEELLHLITKTYGIIGLILISPMFAMKFLWDHNKKLAEQLQAANDRVQEVSNKRVEDSKAIVDKLMQMSSEHASLSKETNLALDRVGDTLSIIQNGGFMRRDRRSGGGGSGQ